jgi:hypothetical protein
MSERETDLAIGVDPPGSVGASCRGRRQDGRRAPRRKWERVVVPSKQHRLQEDRKDAEERRSATRTRRPWFVLQDRCPYPQMHASRIPPGRIAVGKRYTITPPLRRESPFPKVDCTEP